MERYERVKKIGEGSFGKALLVRRRNDGRHCVMKEVNISRMSPKEREESKKEVKVLSQLKHPNIVSYQESFEGMGNLYIVMDYCEGGDLYQRLINQKGANFSEGQVLDFFVQICLALKHIHDRKILHRDLKSQNIFLTKHGIVKLGDFGIARVLKSTVELARTCIGTPYYLSPEICENRPYNNKSDIWSLGCVLYELCTLKHAFEAGNMKNLVLKIIRGNYPPVPNRYSGDLRALVAHCFKRSPMERPSVNKILKKPIIQARIKKFLTPEAIEDEFSHTVLHKEKFGAPRQPIARPVSAGVRNPQSAVAQVYGVSVAKKPVVGAPVARKPLAVPSKRPVSAGRKPGPVAQQKIIDDRRKDLEARERRRRNLFENQEQVYQEYLKNIHKQRYEKQQAQRINRAREAGWKNLLKSDDDKAKKKADVNAVKQDKVMVKQPKPMEKYAQKERNIEDNKQDEAVPEQRPIPSQERKREGIAEQRQIPPQERPFDAWVAAKQAREHGVKGSEAAERARLIEEFRQRKREAAENKARGNYDFQPNSYQQNRQPPLQNEMRANQDHKPPRQPIAPVGISAKNKEEKSYLDQLERIRRQNYQERKAMQNKKPVVYEPSYPASNRADETPNFGVNDPRYDPVARRQKIAALKSQADERAAALREELNKRRRNLQQRLENERNEREQEKKSNLKNKNYERPLPIQKNKDRNKENVAVAAVGLETAMNQVAAARLFRSCSEGDLQQMVKKGQEMIHDRKHWNEEVPLGLADLPLEVTASAMEATSINDAVYKPSPVMEVKEGVFARKNWGKGGKTQLITALENKTLANQTCFPPQSPVKADIGVTISLPKKQEPKADSPIGKTIILPKKSPPNIGETIIIKAKDKATESSNPAAQDENLDETNKVEAENKDGNLKKIEKIEGREDSLSSVESLEEMITDKATDNVLKKSENEAESEIKDIEKPSSENEVEKTEVKNASDDDSEIEELTVVAQKGLAKQQKPKARAAWAANAKPVYNFKEGTARTGDFNEGKEIDAFKQSMSPAKTVLNEEISKAKQEELFKKTGNSRGEEREDLNLQDISVDNDSFHTPNASLLETRKKGLNTGLYDSPAKALRTTSMPELHKLLKDENEEENKDDDADDLQEETEAKNDSENEDDNDEDIDDDDDDDVSDEDKSDEEMEDYEHMLDSLRGVLNSADASPPSSAKVSRSNSSNIELEDKSPSRSPSSVSKSIEEDWDSDDDDDDDDDNEQVTDTTVAAANTSKSLTRTAKRLKARETLFQRIEQSRKTLEDELGTDRFLKVYRYIQAVQENEDDEMDVDPTKDPEIGEILDGENEHLYQRILYLVLADAAYFEDND